MKSVPPLLLLAVLLLGLACAPAPPSPGPLPQLPFAVDSNTTEAIAPGVWHRTIRSSTGPWAIEVLDVRLDRCTTVRAVKGHPGAVGRRTTSAMLDALDDTMRVLGGVNGDFFLFKPAGLPTNALVIDGRVFTGPSHRPVLAIDSSGRARIGVFSGPDTSRFIGEGGASGAISLRPFHPLQAVGGQPEIVRGGTLTAAARDTIAFAVTRHPRTAAGIADDGRRLLLVTVDGRQPGWSVGMRLDELGRLLLALGAQDAINLDGGGSTAMVVRRPGSYSLRVVNRPSDKGGERPVGDAIAVIRSCPP